MYIEKPMRALDGNALYDTLTWCVFLTENSANISDLYCILMDYFFQPTLNLTLILIITSMLLSKTDLNFWTSSIAYM